ncbi:hypothetical protein H9649_15570 [Sporosarcina sp. Sa2YVA2]|uniref:Uncharacterized protein n=1 Tax=Sporosarcina quadrami TaxID=2762234 RepID=A0ABR8UDA0_9BACL|nr:hypothetical protein [Sporosarcina quadrami]MBD7985990.1 hypothetical protein [Sporosarcina quadrami]
MLRRKAKRKENNERYSALDILADILLFVPELLFLPIRLVLFLLRPLLRLIGDIW